MALRVSVSVCIPVCVFKMQSLGKSEWLRGLVFTDGSGGRVLGLCAPSESLGVGEMQFWRVWDSRLAKPNVSLEMSIVLTLDSYSPSRRR